MGPLVIGLYPGPRAYRLLALASAGLVMAAATALRPATTVAGGTHPSYQPLDIVLIIDRSASMDEVTPNPDLPIVPGVNNTRLGWANDAANDLVSALEISGGIGAGGLHQVGLVTYGAGGATTDMALGTAGAAAVHAAIDVWDGFDGNGNTPLKQGMDAAVATMGAGARPEVGGLSVTQVFILLSDGRPNPDPGARPNAGDIAAYLGAADQTFSIAVGDGSDDPGAGPDLALMETLASPSANYTFTADAADLPSLFAEIANELTSGDDPKSAPTPAPTPGPAVPAPSKPQPPAQPIAPSPPTEQPVETTTPAPTPTPSATTAERQAAVPPVPPTPPTHSGVVTVPDDRRPVHPVGGFFAAAVEHVGRVLNPESAIVVASTFGFPLALMLAVLGFLVAQSRIDARDPKLRTAPRAPQDLVLAFRDEGEL
jgi:hypothetical protein